MGMGRDTVPSGSRIDHPCPTPTPPKPAWTAGFAVFAVKTVETEESA